MTAWTHRRGFATGVLTAAVAFALACAPAWGEEVIGRPAPATLELVDDRATDAPPGEWPVSVAFDTTWAGKYVWRGIVVTEDPVFQPSVEVGIGDLTLNVWANLDTTDVNDSDDQANEIDYTLDYSVFSWKGLTASLGAIHYAFPQAHALDTTEAYLALDADVPASPTLTVYQDLDEHDGQYMTLGFSHTFEDVWIASPDVAMSVELSAQFAWGSRRHNAFYYGAGSGWADTVVGVALPLAIGENVTLTPYANYMWILDDGITGALGRDGAFWAGLSVTVGF